MLIVNSLNLKKKVDMVTKLQIIKKKYLMYFWRFGLKDFNFYKVIHNKKTFLNFYNINLYAIGCTSIKLNSNFVKIYSNNKTLNSYLNNKHIFNVFLIINFNFGFIFLFIFRNFGLYRFITYLKFFTINKKKICFYNL